MAHKTPTSWDRAQQNQILTLHSHGEEESQFVAWPYGLSGNGCTKDRSLGWACFSSAHMVDIAASLGGHTQAHVCPVSSITRLWSKCLIYGSLLLEFFLNTPKLNSWWWPKIYVKVPLPQIPAWSCCIVTKSSVFWYRRTQVNISVGAANLHKQGPAPEPLRLAGNSCRQQFVLRLGMVADWFLFLLLHSSPSSRWGK